MIVDFCVSIERGIGNGIQPQMMPDRSAKTGRLDRTKECIKTVYSLQCTVDSENANTRHPTGWFCVSQLLKQIPVCASAGENNLLAGKPVNQKPI